MTREGTKPPGDRSAPSLAPFAVLGKYQILRHLATGGMAELYLARTRGIADFEKVVVLKRILARHARDAEFVSRFLAEARLAATLQHRNIIQVYDIGSVEDVYFFTMEYVHGVDLRQLLGAAMARDGRLPLELAIGIAIDAAAGLHYAHEKTDADGFPLGLVHRDVSPANLLVGYDGSVKVGDFGVATATLQRRQTRPGLLRGKVRYMSPEQCRGEPLDRRSDVFSLAAVIYELTTGAPLFDGDGDYAVLQRIAAGTVIAPTARVASYPPALERVLLRALSRAQEDRQASAEELLIELDAFARDHGLHVATINLTRYLEGLFADELQPWRDAQRSGVSLVEFVTAAVEPYQGGERAAELHTATEGPLTETLPGASPAPAPIATATDTDGRRPATRVALLAVGGLVAAAVGFLSWAAWRAAPTTTARSDAPRLKSRDGSQLRAARHAAAPPRPALDAAGSGDETHDATGVPAPRTAVAGAPRRPSRATARRRPSRSPRRPSRVPSRARRPARSKADRALRADDRIEVFPGP